MGKKLSKDGHHQFPSSLDNTCCSTHQGWSLFPFPGIWTVALWLALPSGMSRILGVLSPSLKRNGSFNIHPLGNQLPFEKFDYPETPMLWASPRQPCGEPAKAPNVSKGFVTQLTQILLNTAKWETPAKARRTTSWVQSAQICANIAILSHEVWSGLLHSGR